MASKQSHAWMQSVLDHKALVARYMQRAVAELFRRAVVHDDSKFRPPEFGPYAAALPRFQRAPYGSAEYAAVCQSVAPAIQHHVTHNRHHPEYYPDGVNGMDLLDVLEMVCDWIAAAQRVPGGTLRLDLQRERFGLDDQLFGIIERTVAHLCASPAPDEL